MRLALALLAALFVAPLLAGGSALAHHGWGDYDVQRRLVLEGEILAVEYAYPHVSIDLQDGDKTWHVILAPPSRMERRGILPDDLAVGRVVMVVGYPSKNEIGEMRAESITLDDQTIPMR